MHGSAPRRLPHGRSGRRIRVLCRRAGINPRRCFCMRCIAARIGLVRSTQVQVGRRTYSDVRVLGMRVSHRLAFEAP